MAIWKTPFTLQALNHRARNTLISYLEIEFVEQGDDFLIAKMPITSSVKQPIGILHGGASCVLAETVGSTAGNFCIDLSTHYCVGLEININHLRPKKEGTLFAKASPLHLGKKTHVWSIDIYDENDERTAISRHTLMVLPRQ